MRGKTSRAPAESASRTDTTREKDGAAHHLEEILFFTSTPPGQRCRLCSSSSTGRLEAPVTLPASSGELPRAPGRGRWLATKEQHYPHRAPHLPPGHPGAGSGLESRDTDAEAGGSTPGVCGPWSQGKEPREWNLPIRRSLGREAAGPGPDCSQAGAAVTAAGSRAHRARGSGTPVRGRPHSARPSTRPEDPADPLGARNTPLTRRPTARGRRRPTRGLPAARPADRATKPAQEPARRGPISWF